jgi:hypothetical protein
MLFTDPIFTFPDTILATGVDRKSIENWMVHGHVTPSADAARRDRRFSLADMLQIVLLRRLRDPINVQAATAAFIATEAVNNYAPHADADLVDIWQGGELGATSYRPAYELTKDANGELRATERGDRAHDGVMIVLPVGLLARGLFAKAKLIIDARLAQKVDA